MTLLDAGYWQTTYWAENYWNPSYWPRHGAAPTAVGYGYRTRRRPLQTVEDEVDLHSLYATYIMFKTLLSD